MGVANFTTDKASLPPRGGEAHWTRLTPTNLSYAQRATELLLCAKFDSQAANDVGQTLAKLCDAQPELLGQMQVVFAEQITRDLSPNDGAVQELLGISYTEGTSNE